MTTLEFFRVIGAFLVLAFTGALSVFGLLVAIRLGEAIWEGFPRLLRKRMKACEGDVILETSDPKSVALAAHKIPKVTRVTVVGEGEQAP